MEVRKYRSCAIKSYKMLKKLRMTTEKERKYEPDPEVSEKVVKCPGSWWLEEERLLHDSLGRYRTKQRSH